MTKSKAVLKTMSKWCAVCMHVPGHTLTDTHAHTNTHTHRCLLSAASLTARLIWLPLRKSVCFHTTLSSAKANVLNIHRVLLSISDTHTQTHTALGADEHWFLVLTEPNVGIWAKISKLGCSEKISTSYDVDFSPNSSKFVVRRLKWRWI